MVPYLFAHLKEKHMHMLYYQPFYRHEIEKLLSGSSSRSLSFQWEGNKSDSNPACPPILIRISVFAIQFSSVFILHPPFPKSPFHDLTPSIRPSSFFSRPSLTSTHPLAGAGMQINPAERPEGNRTNIIDNLPGIRVVPRCFFRRNNPDFHCLTDGRRP